MALRRGLLSRHVGVLLALLVLPLIPVFIFGQPLRPRVVLPELDGKIVEFSSDGRTLLTDGASGGCVRDAATGGILSHLRRKDNTRATDITWPRFTPDGKRLIVQIGGERFGNHQTRTVTLAVFDAATGREMAAFEPVGANAWGNSGPEYALSADGSTLAFVPKVDKLRGGRIVVWDVDAGKTVAEFPGRPPLALTTDGGMIAHGDADQDCDQPAIRVLMADRNRALTSSPCSHDAERELRAADVLPRRPQADDAAEIAKTSIPRRAAHPRRCRETSGGGRANR